MVPDPIKNIMVVDDEEVSRSSMERILILYDYKVSTQKSAEDALNYLQNAEANNEPFPELVITDYRMGEKNGIDFIVDVKTRFKGKKIKVILVSAYFYHSPILQRLHQVADAFIEKPFSHDRLLATIKEIEVIDDENGEKRN